MDSAFKVYDQSHPKKIVKIRSNRSHAASIEKQVPTHQPYHVQSHLQPYSNSMTKQKLVLKGKKTSASADGRSDCVVLADNTYLSKAQVGHKQFQVSEQAVIPIKWNAQKNLKKKQLYTVIKQRGTTQNQLHSEYRNEGLSLAPSQFSTIERRAQSSIRNHSINRDSSLGSVQEAQNYSMFYPKGQNLFYSNDQSPLKLRKNTLF